MKKLWGTFLLGLIVAFGGVAGLLTFNGASGARVNAAVGDDPLKGLTINYSDDFLLKSGTVISPDAPYENYTEIGYTHSLENHTAGIVKFAEYNGYGAYSDIKKGTHRYLGTMGTFIFNLPANQGLTAFEDSNSWYRITYIENLGGTKLENKMDWTETVAPQVPMGTNGWVDKSGNGLSLTGSSRLDFEFEEHGIYNFKINSIIDGQITPVVTEFNMVVRREVPEFRAHFPDNRSPYNAIPNEYIKINSKFAAKGEVYYVEFRQVWGYYVEDIAKFNTVQAIDTNIGLPAFFSIQQTFERGTNTDDKSVFDRVNGKNKYPQLAIARTSDELPIVDGIYKQIRFVVKLDTHYQDITKDGQLTTSTNTFTVGEGKTTIEFATPKKSGGFPYWTLIAGLGIIGSLVAAWYLSNRFAIFVQVRDIRKKRKQEEATEMARLDNMEKMRAAQRVSTPQDRKDGKKT